MLDYFLQGIATSHPAYLKDTWHFIECLGQTTVPPNALIVTCDVASMYTNIDIPAALKIIEREVDRIQGTPGLPPTDDFIRMLRLSLERNDFKFNGSFYLQLRGTAMGKKYAPSFANIFMANWEERMLDQAQHQPALYKRYLDDIFMIWTEGELNLSQFLQQANALDSSIQLEAEKDSYGLPYLRHVRVQGRTTSPHGTPRRPPLHQTNQLPRPTGSSLPPSPGHLPRHGQITTDPLLEHQHGRDTLPPRRPPTVPQHQKQSRLAVQEGLQQENTPPHQDGGAP